MMRYFLSIFLLVSIILSLAAKAGNNDAFKLLRTEKWNITDAHVAQICRDKSLTELDLSGCHKITLKCLDDVVTLKKLKSLDLSWDTHKAGHGSHNKWPFGSMETFKKLTALPALERLSLRDCPAFQGKGVELLKKLKILDAPKFGAGHQPYSRYGSENFAGYKLATSLTHLNVSQNSNRTCKQDMRFDGLKSLKHLPNLKVLQMYGLCNFKDDEFNSIFSELKNIEHLEMGFNSQLKGERLIFPKGLVTLDLRDSHHLQDKCFLSLDKSKLENLNLIGCHNLTGKTLDTLKKAKALKKLQISGLSKLTDASLKSLHGLSGLTHLTLSDCYLITDKGILNFARMSQLKVLILWNNNAVKGRGVSILRTMSSLQTLDLSDCANLEDVALSHVKGRKSLKYLHLDNCAKLSDKGFSYLSGLSNLEELTLMGCVQITNRSLEHFKGLNKLKYLDITGCSNLSSGALNTLRQALPNCTVVQ